MKRIAPILIVAVGLSLVVQAVRAAEAPAKDYPIQAVPFTEVRIADSFWSPRLETNRVVTIPYAFEKCEETGRIDNFAKAGKLKEGKFEGIYFNDSDVYKVVEGAAYALAIQRDPKLEAYVDGVIDKIAAAQEPDGYLYTARTLCGPDYMPPGGKERWSDISGGHELYCVGHLYEGAIAYFQATGKRKLLDVALKNAELICREFGPNARPHPPGHQQIEIGFARLYRITGDEKYLRQAKFFLDTRGKPNGRGLYGEYSQDHKPVVEQEEAVGHAVRAAYMYTGMADVAALTGDAAYVKAIQRIWDDVVGRKLYLTGGIGAAGGHEGFGAEYFLPNRTAYCETCASVANAMWNHRMFLWTGEGRFMDIAERVIYNAFLSGISMEGDRFFYPNRLEAFRGERRQPWFACACCPANIVRFVPSIPGYAYAHRADTLYVNLFIGGDTSVKLGGQTVKVKQETRYPWDGRVALTMTPEEAGAFELALRVPGWARNEPVPGELYRFADRNDANPTLRVNGKNVKLDIRDGFARVRRSWKAGDRVEFELPMPVRRVVCDSRVVANLGRVAIQRGPIVYCAEGIDQKDARILYQVLPDSAELRAVERPDLLNGVVTVTGKSRLASREAEGTPRLGDEQDLTLIPYYAQAHRELTPMSVWISQDVKTARALPAPTIAATSKVKVSRGTGVEALNDQLEALSSDDHTNPFFHWWPKKEPREWVEYHFAKPTRVSSVEVYWFDDHGGCRLPQGWKLLAKTGDEWKEVSNPSGYGVVADRFNACNFDPVETDALRLEVQLPERAATGIHEWRVSGVAVAAAAATGTTAAAPAPARNLIANASMEEVAGNRPRGWRQDRWGGEGAYQLAEIGHTGKRSLMVSSEKGADIGWATTATVEPFARYRLSGWIKTEGLKTTGARGALFNVHNIQPVATPALKGDNDWSRVEVEFETEDQDAVQINCLFGGWGLATGKAWYDDVGLELIGRKEMPAPHIRIDAGKIGEPLSKYIYGQFIEHLGRCIYGGIWAEMLEDRKFYYAVDARESPWKAVGLVQAVGMARENSFVGDQTPRVNLAGGTEERGIAQGGLALKKGASYTGRVWLAGEGGPVRVSLVWGPSPQERDTVPVKQLTPEYKRADLKFKAGADTDRGRLEITAAAGSGHFLVGTVSLMPANHVQGMRPDTLELLRRLDSPVYRWPGGNFVSGYNWKDGIGDPDRRPPRKNPAWRGVEHNDFGLDEFMVFCRLLGTEPYIAINSGLGEATSAVEELQYANGAPDTPMGKWRAQNGHSQPYSVKWWGIGNEMYGNWQLGNMPLTNYVKKHNLFAEALRKADPSIKLVAVGDVGPWSEGMMRHCADHMDLISEHFYCQERPGLYGHIRQIPDAIRRKAEGHRRYRQQFDSLKGKDIRIAMDEWNYWYGPHVFGELGTRYFLKDGLGIAAGLHEYARQSDLVFMANYAQTVNVIGAIKTSKTSAEMETTGLVLELYRRHFGVLPVTTETTGLIDAQAAWSSDRKRLTVGIVNPTSRETTIPLELKGAQLTGQGMRWQIAGDDPMVYNDPDQPPRVRIEESKVSGVFTSVKVAPCSVTVLALEVR